MKALSFLPLALPLLAVPLLVATSTGETAIAPRGLVVLAVALLFAALAGREGRRPRLWLDLPLAVLMGLAAQPPPLLAGPAAGAGAFAETAALALLPLAFLFGVVAIREGGRRSFAAAAVAIALLIVTHPISAMMSAIGLGVWILAGLAAERREGLRRLPAAAGRMAGVWLLGAALAGFFVVPFVTGVRHLVVGEVALGGQRHLFFRNGLTPAELVRRRLWTERYPAGAAGDLIDGTDREMPLYFGLGLLSLLPLAAGLGRPLTPIPSPIRAGRDS